MSLISPIESNMDLIKELMAHSMRHFKLSKYRNHSYSEEHPELGHNAMVL